MRFLQLFKSRTFWTVVVLFVVNGFEGVRELLPGAWLPIVDALLGVLAIYFGKISPKVVI